MAGGFDITTTVTSLTLPPSRTGQLVYTVTNTSGRPLTAHVVIVTPQSPDQKSWFSIEGAVERPAPPGVGLQYVVNIAVPPTAPAGTVIARLDALAKEDPDAYAQQGPPVNVEVPPAVVAPPPRQFPWWIIAVAVAVLLVLGGGGYAVMKIINDHNQSVVQASPSPSGKGLPPGFSAGTWVNTVTNPGDAGPRQIVIQTTPSGVVATPTFSVCFTHPPFWCNIGGQQSGPATYSATRQQFTFSWVTGSDTIQFTVSFTPGKGGQTVMIVVMTWDGGSALTYYFTQ